MLTDYTYPRIPKDFRLGNGGGFAMVLRKMREDGLAPDPDLETTAFSLFETNFPIPDWDGEHFQNEHGQPR